MTVEIDPAILLAISQEARQCFLEEDAPLYIETLQTGMQPGSVVDYPALLRAAHSLKGGAGLAQMPSLSQLAHRLEDVIESIQHQQAPDPEFAWQLVNQGIEEAAFVLSQAQTSPDLEVTPDIILALEEFLDQVRQANPVSPDLEQVGLDTGMNATQLSLLKGVLETDLGECLSRAEQILQQSEAGSIEAAELTAGLSSFVDECTLLAETLELGWLSEAAGALSMAMEAPSADLPLAQAGQFIVTQIQSQRTQLLTTLASPIPPDHRVSFNQPVDQPDQDQEQLAEINKPLEADPAFALNETPTDTGLEIQGVEPTSDPLQSAQSSSSESSGKLTTSRNLASAPIRIPLQRLEGMTNRVGELIIRFERFSLQQQQLKQASQELQRLSQQFQPVREQIQSLYDQFSTLHTQAGSAGLMPQGDPMLDPSLTDMVEFDPLELDRYTALHTSLQTFEELITRIQETRADIDLVNREVMEDLEQGRTDLDVIYSDVTGSRLVPFRTLAQRFVPQLQRLAQRFQKQAELVTEGESVLVDQILLEQLQTPLMHLLNNAIDHGIERPEDRQELGKPSKAQIRLQAKLDGNQVVLTFQDDGRGIDLEKVYHKAVQQGLCSADVAITQLHRDQILDFIFQTGFSTATEVSMVSGRGVGLDVVRREIQQLRGDLQVDTLPGQGTTFTIRLPLGLNLLALMLCQAQRQLIAIPATSVLEILLYSELVGSVDANGSGSASSSHDVVMTSWRGQPIPVVPLVNLLPYREQPAETIPPRVAIVLEGSESPIAIAIDALVGERQLVLKPFDDTVPVPPYVAGCTILGTGDVVPVMLPYHFGTLLKQRQRATTKVSITPQRQRRLILVAEDSVATRRAVERILTQAGYAVIACRDGQEALDELNQRKHEVDLVVTDIEMPRLTGFELLQSIRSHEELFGLPVALLTSRTGERHRQRAFSLGANGYLNKPVDPKILVREIGKLLPLDQKAAALGRPQ